MLRLQFGEFLLDTTERALFRAGVRVAVEPKVLDCIELLASKPGGLTTTERLHAVLWPRVRVAGGALRRIINEARRALGDDGHRQAVIRSRRRLGYVFLLEVRQDTSRGQAETDRSWPFLGRQRELARLRDWLARGRGGLCFVTAEAGMGKSTLLARLASESTPADGRWLFGGCRAVVGTPAFWPFRELAKQLDADPALRAAMHALVAQRPELLRLVPELAVQRRSRASAPPVDAEERFALCEALAELFRALSRVLPLYVALEDLHWSDDGSLLVVDALMRIEQPHQLFVFASYRPEALAGDSALGRLIARSSGRDERFSVHLAPLGLDELTTLLRLLQLRHSPAALLRLTGGNALYVRELLRHVQGTGADLDTALPPNLQHILSERFAGMSPSVRTLLAQAAVLGDTFDCVGLAAVVGQTPQAIELALDPELRSGLLRHSSPPSQSLRFSHALVRDALLGQVPQTFRCALHQAAWRSLSGQPLGTAPKAELAMHAFEAGDLISAAERRLVCEQAGLDAFASLAFDRAALHLGRALQLVASDDDSTASAQLALSFARARWHADHSEREVEAAFLEAAARACRASSPALLAEAAMGYALGDQSNTAMRIASLRPEARELAEQAWTRLCDEPGVALSSWPDALAYRLAATLCWLRVEAGELTDITHAARRACALAPDALDSVQRLWLLALRSAAEPERASALIEQLQRAMQDARLDARRSVELYAAIMSARLTLGETEGWEQAARELARAAELLPAPRAGRAGERATIYMTLPLSAEITRAVMQGRLADAEQRFRDAVAFAERMELTRSREGEHSGFHLLLQLLGYLGRSAMLEAHVDRELVEDPQRHWFGALLKAQFALERGDEEAARRHFAPLRATGFRPTIDGRLLLTKPETLVRATELSVQVGGPADAAVLYAALRSREARCIQDGALISWGSCSRPLGALAFQLGDMALAERHFRAALAMNERIGHQPELVRTRIGLARVELAAGQTGSARALLARVEQDAGAMGMAPMVDLARSLSQRCGE